MRRDFKPILLDEMRKNDKIILCTADLGYKFFDEIAAEFPKRFYNVGAAEQLLIGVGIGMAEEGLIPVCYSITPFLLKRPFEWIDNYLNHEKVPVKLLGGGRKKDYAEDGYSHDASMDSFLMMGWTNIKSYWPHEVSQLKDCTHEWLYNGQPSYLNLKR